MGKNPRDNEDWLADLSAGGEMQESALRDLRELIMLGLGKTFFQQGEAFIQDAAQVALLQIFKNRNSFAGRSKFSTWAMTIAVRTAVSDLRKNKWRHVSLDEMADSGETEALADSSAADPSRINSQTCIKEKLREMVDNILTEKQRTAILAELNGVPMEEIAVKQASSLNATYKLLHDARKRLKVALEALSINIEDVAHAFSN